MCGRFAVVIPKKYQSFVSDLDLSFLDVPGEMLLPRYNVSPGQQIPVIVQTRETLLTTMHWGYKPHWIPGFDREMINAKSETVDTKSVFKPAFEHHRCLILATGFYEWKKAGTRKIPYYFSLKDNPVFAFAGIFSAPDQKFPLVDATTAILTATPNELVATVHDRMPVILTGESARHWVQDTDTVNLKTYFQPYPARKMQTYEVSQMVNSTRNGGEELIRPVERLISF
jgi:putative SOS response-associated peptidase YedK